MISSSHVVAPNKTLLVLADGENLVLRYQDMAQTRTKLENVVHIPDIFVWQPKVLPVHGWSTVRVNYYTSATAAEDQILKFEAEIARNPIFKTGEVHAQLCPRIFKKEAKSKKTRLVDISITIDALRHSYHRDVEAVFLLSGDGDYLHLVQEIMRNGTQVWLGAFSSGLNSKLPSAVDRFVDLDRAFFKPT